MFDTKSYFKVLATPEGAKINSVAYVANKRNLFNSAPLISVSANDASALPDSCVM